MKPLRKHLKLIAHFVLLITFSFGCSKESMDEDIIIDYGKIQFKIDGNLTVIDERCYASDSWTLVVIGAVSCQDKIRIVLQIPNTVGTYSFKDLYSEIRHYNFLQVDGISAGCPNYTGNDDEFKYFIKDEGNITLTEIFYKGEGKASAKGTFNFTCKNDEGDIITVTDGIFDIK
jgi:hypothetical protein